MLPASRRLNSANVEKTLKGGFSVASGGVRAKVLERKTAQLSRFAVIVSKKVAGGAVMRNKLRRQAFASVEVFPAFKTPYDVALLIGKKYTSFKELNADIHSALQKLK